MDCAGTASSLGNSSKAMPVAAKEIEVRWKRKGEGASLGAPPPKIN
jgi:hypothetical protein